MLGNVASRFHASTMHYDPDLTECILFGTKRRLAKAENFEVHSGEALIKRVTSVKYLGVTLDQYLDFSVHVDQMGVTFLVRISQLSGVIFH